jgi:putative Mg2+ transporter-C (MgtC) family protein
MMDWLTPQDQQMILRLFLATFCGALIGLEREIHGKEAGFRTHALVSLGSGLVMLISIDLYAAYRGVAQVDPSRIAAQVVSGVGFLGAGAIIRFPKGITGLTTAASLWASAAIGLACGAGFFRPALVSTALVLIILFVFAQVGRLFRLKDV